jgi:acyl-CoA thioester hydrolase
LICPEIEVASDWIDYNGHMNMAFYNVVFDKSVDHLLDLLGIGETYAATTNHALFSMEIHVTYAQEVVLGDPLQVNMQLLDHDAKRLHLFMQMHHAKEGFLAATCEQLSLHVDRGVHRAAPMPEATLERVAQLQQRHSRLKRPDAIGRVIGITRR